MHELDDALRFRFVLMLQVTCPQVSSETLPLLEHRAYDTYAGMIHIDSSKKKLKTDLAHSTLHTVIMSPQSTMKGRKDIRNEQFSPVNSIN